MAVGQGTVEQRYSAPAKTASEIIADLMREIMIDSSLTVTHVYGWWLHAKIDGFRDAFRDFYRDAFRDVYRDASFDALSRCIL